MTRSVLLHVYHDASKDIAGGKETSSVSFSVVFNGILSLLLRLLCTKDEERAQLQNRIREREAIVPSTALEEEEEDDDDTLKKAYSRIHDLLAANEQQTQYYSHLLEAMQKKCSSVPVAPQMEIPSVTSSERVQELQMEINSLKSTLETTQEDVKMLQSDNSRGFAIISS